MHTRRALTLIELLVVTSIMAILMGMILSAVARTRRAALVTRCENNLHHIGIGLTDYQSQFGVFPSNGGWDGKQTIPAKDGGKFTPETYVIYTKVTLPWGTGDPALGPTQQTGSWAFSILPFIEADVMFQKRKWTEPEPLYICPARRTPESEDSVSSDQYCDYITGGWTWGKTDYAANSAAIPLRPKCRSDIEFDKGLSNTIMVGEKAYDSGLEFGTWFFDEPFFLGGSASTTRGGPNIYRDGAGLLFKHNWGSNHNAGAQFLYGDGSIHFLSFDTDVATMQSLLSLH